MARRPPAPTPLPPAVLRDTTTGGGGPARLDRLLPPPDSTGPVPHETPQVAEDQREAIDDRPSAHLTPLPLPPPTLRLRTMQVAEDQRDSIDEQFFAELKALLQSQAVSAALRRTAPRRAEARTAPKPVPRCALLRCAALCCAVVHSLRVLRRAGLPIAAVMGDPARRRHASLPLVCCPPAHTCPPHPPLQFKDATNGHAPGNTPELASAVLQVFDSAWRAALAVRQQ